MSDKSGKTEQPTPNRIKKARDEGSYAVSRHLPVAAVLWLWFFVLTHSAPALGADLAALLRGALRGLAKPAQDATSGGSDGVRYLLATIHSFAPLLLIPVVAVLAIQLMMTGFGLKGYHNVVGGKQFNPAKKISNLIQNAKHVVIESLLGLVAAYLLLHFAYSSIFSSFSATNRFPLFASLRMVGDNVSRFLFFALSLCLVLGIADYAQRMHAYKQGLKMTKQEIRDEYKQLNGHPEIKARIRRLRMTMSRQRMFAAIPTATVVVTNPTHYAVALKYDAATMACPVVVALGVDYLALRIRQLATSSGVPIVEHPPLAQALYKNCSVGQHIPTMLYRAVAEVLAFVFRASGAATRA